MAVARLGYEIDSSGAVKAAADLDKMSAAATKAERAEHVLAAGSKKASTDMFTLGGAVDRAAASIIKGQKSATIAAASFTGMGADVAATARELELYGAEMDRIRSKFDPLFAASKRYEQELREIAEAEKMGAINANVAAQARERAAAGLNSGAVAVGRFSTATAAGASQTANLGAQLNDIGVMLAAGQSPLQLAVQQGTQINQVFAQMGGGKAALRGLAAGFMSMVNPMSLATIGIIAGGAALVQWGIAAATAGDNGKELADAMRDIEESTRNAKLELMAMQMGLANIEQVAVQQEINALNQQRVTLIERLGRLEEKSDIHSMRMAAATGRQIEMLDKQVAKLEGVIKGEDDVTKALEQQNYILEQANMFREAQQRLRNEAGAKLEEMIQLEAALNKELGDGASEILKAAGVDLSNIDEAARRAASLAASMGIAFQEAYALANVDFSPFGGGLTPNMPNLLPTQDELHGTNAKPRRRGGGGGGASRVDTFARDLEALRESLRTESEVLTEWKSEQDAILANDRAMEILGIEGHNEAKLRLEKEYQERLAEVKEAERGGNLAVMSDFFGEAAGLMQSGNEKLFKIGKAAAVANAIVNGYSAAVAAWDKGMQAGGPPLAAAFTALSVAKTAAQISSLKSASFGGGGGGSGGGTSSGITASAPEPQRQQTRAIISVQSGRSRFTIEEMNDIARGLQDLSDEGVIIEGFTRA